MVDRVSRLEAVVVPLADTLGAVLAGDLVSPEQVPPFANSAMDGYAVRAVDTGDGVELQVLETIAAGAAPTRVVGSGQASRIMTGAPMPDGADSVIMVELTTASADGSVVRLAGSVAVGQSVRPAGDDIEVGDTVLSAGAVLTPAAMAVAATVGATSIEVVRPPVVGVMSTGDELVAGGAPLGVGQIRDSNRLALLALVRLSGATPVDLGLIPDDAAGIEAALRDGAARCDAIVSSGGVSMGDFDFVKEVLDRIGDMRWMQVAIKPAKPLAFGTISVGNIASGAISAGGGSEDRHVPVFGLPGNPVSSQVSFELFARPALRKMMGHSVLARRRWRCVAPDGLPRRSDGKIHFVRVIVDQDDEGRFQVRSSGGQSSHHSVGMAAADGLAVLVDGEGVAPGGVVEVIPLIG